MYLANRSKRLSSNQGTKSKFRRLVLNNCGITGKEAARLFNAIGENHGIHLFLSGNPLEVGIEHLANAIQHSRGPTGLHMDLVDFEDERSYTLLIEALTVTKHISLLSLVGTAPVLPTNAHCSEETLRALEDFFARNKSISYLDMSGYKAKLDDGQLARGFGHTLQGLIMNDTLTHLCIRNQNLHADVGSLGNILRRNQSLVAFDCQANGFNLTSLQFLVQALRDNRSVIDFPISPAEKDRIWTRVLSDLKRSGERPTSRMAKNLKSEPEVALRQVFEQSLTDLNGYLDRNQSTLELDASEMWNSHASLDGAVEAEWPREPQVMGTDDNRAEKSEGVRRRRGTLRSTAMTINTSLATPYQVRPEEGMESPTETLSPATAESVSPPEPASPGTPDDVIFQTVLQNLKECGFDNP